MRSSDPRSILIRERKGIPTKAAREMALFQVVAVYPSGNRCEVRRTRQSFLHAEMHRKSCERDVAASDWSYEIDMHYTDADGQTHLRQNVTGEDLGYSPEEIADVVVSRSEA